MNKQNDTPAKTTLVFETSHEARTQAADHLETIVREARMTRTDAYRDNAKGTDHARYTLEVPADQADDTGRSIAQDLTANGIQTTWYTDDDPGPDPKPATPEAPEAAAARFWREGSEAQGGGTPEFEAKDVEEWLTPITDPDRREATRKAIYDRAEPMNLPEHIMPRFDERQLRDILGDTQTDLDAEREEHEETKRERDEAQERIEELEEALKNEEEDHQETKEAAEQGDAFSPEHGMTWEEALKEAAEEAEEARTNPDTGNTWEDDLKEAQTTLVEWANKHDEEKAKREAAEERAKFWEEEHERNRDRISRILDAYFKRDDKAAREAAGAGPFLKAKIRNNAAMTTAEEKAILDLIKLTEETTDDGTPNGRDAWAGPTADDDETGWREAAANKTTDNE